jgi:protein-disulfide isomerase
MVLTLGLAPWCRAQNVPAEGCEKTAAGGSSESQDRIITELKAIRLQLARIEKRLNAAAPGEEPVKLDVSSSYVMGRKDAPVTVAEFTDYQCPFCRQFHTQTFQKLQKEYIDTGKVRFVAFDLPLKMHADARQAAEAALCAGDQSRFWEMRNLLFTNDKVGTDASLAYAEKLGLDQDAFRACIATSKYAERVEADATRAEGLNISGTPTFVVGRTQGAGVEGIKLVGNLSYSQLENRISTLLGPQP